jgi:hypothetical protein
MRAPASRDVLMLRRAAPLLAFVALTACAASHGSSDGGSDADVSGAGTCVDRMTELSAAAHRYSGSTPLPCGPSFGHCSECFYDYDCVMGFVFIRVNGVRCDTGPRPIEAGPDVR